MPAASSNLPAVNKVHSASHANWPLIRRLLALGWRYRLGCFVVLVQQVTLVTLSTAALSLTGLGIDVLRAQLDPQATAPRWPLGLTPPEHWPTLGVLAIISGGILLIAVINSVLKYCGTVSSSRLAQAIVVTLRSNVYDKIQRLSFRFFDTHESGSIINRVAGDVQAVRMFIDGVIIQVLTVILSLVIYLGYMFGLHVPLTIACLASTPLLWVGTIIFSRKVRPGYIRSSELVDQLVRIVSENIQGVSVVKGFARENEELAKFEAAGRAARDQKQKIFRQISIFQPLMGFLTQINMMVLLGYGGYLVIVGELSLGGGLFVFVNLLSQFANQVAQVTNIANSIQTSLTGAQRVFEVLDAPVEIQSSPEAVRLNKARGEIRFEHVSFGYLPDEEVLHDIDFTIEPGQSVAVVGATGAGKTTLLNLLPRFYDPTAGRVLIDGVDVRDIHLDDLRRNIGLVFQESFIFSNTAGANIAFGRPHATSAQVETAAQIAAAHPFIADLPNGYDTVIGEYGSNLSGGQKQRLAIARAVLLEPPILILDDALAAIDPETEHEVLQALDAVTAGRTTFIVAHRLSTLRRADLILVLEHGRIVERGTHAELMQRSGHYRRAAKSQLLAEETPILEGNARRTSA